VRNGTPLKTKAERITGGSSIDVEGEKIAGLERDLPKIRARLAGAESQSIQLQVRDTRRFVDARLRSLPSVLSGEPQLARAEIAKHVERITLTPEGKTMIASGTWELLERGCYSGAGGGNSSLQPQIDFRLKVAA
jgi:hypothetical protein